LYEFSDFMLLMWQVPAENNVVKETQYYPDDTVDEIREFILTYNAQQYPVQGIFRTIVNGQQVDKNLKFTYN
jgi:hypothetical protein